jgi:hypothetical protein
MHDFEQTIRNGITDVVLYKKSDDIILSVDIFVKNVLLFHYGGKVS